MGMGEVINAYRILVGKPEVKRPLAMIILMWIVGKQGVKMWIELIWLVRGTSGWPW
jgi:hypothetical protein